MKYQLVVVFIAVDSTYFPGRCAEIVGRGGKVVGKLGVLHSEVLSATCLPQLWKWTFNLSCDTYTTCISLENA